jgi:hypothetical protein
LAPIHVRRGELQAAEFLLRDLAHLRSSENEELAAAYAYAEAEVLRAQDRPSEALERARMAAQSGGQLGLARQVVKRGLVQAIESALAMDDTRAAEELMDVVRESRPGLVTPYLRGHGARFAARLAAARGEDESVESGFRAAGEVFREIPMPFDLGVTLLEHAEWLAGQGRHDESRGLADEAVGIFERLRAAPWLERAAGLAPPEGPLAEATAATETGAPA